jgi:hypothetical protein
MPIPGLAPVAPTSAICLGCGNRMRLEVEKYKNGKVSRLVLFCDTCKYGHEPSMQHLSGTPAPYAAPKDPEVHGKALVAAEKGSEK